jgi:hypothetical protein
VEIKAAHPEVKMLKEHTNTKAHNFLSIEPPFLGIAHIL